LFVVVVSAPAVISKRRLNSRHTDMVADQKTLKQACLSRVKVIDEQQMIHLPGDSQGLQILDSSSDGQYLVGPGIFRHTGPGELDYEILSQSHWASPPDAFEFPATISGITQVATQYFAAADYLNSDFEHKVGVWNGLPSEGEVTSVRCNWFSIMD